MPPYNIQERTFEFSVAVVSFCRELSDANPVSRRLGWQLLDASTSIGANLEEADGGQTTADFIAKVAIAKKEAKESVYWLRLIAATDLRWRTAITPLLREAKEIASVVSTIKKNAEANRKRR